MGLIERLPPGPIALDTAVFIYLIEDHPDFAVLPRLPVLQLDEVVASGR